MTVDDCELGFVGLGAMGACMALRLLKHGGGLAVFDSRAEAMAPLVAEGAVPCSSPADVARRAETVFASLPTPEIVQSVVLGEQGLLNEHAMRTFVDLSTTGPSMAGEIAKYLDDAGVAYLDAPVSGGPLRARDGQLTVMAAGANTVFKEVAPLLSLLASTIVHVGREPGQGQLAKLLNNLLSASAIVITAEALALGVKQGLEPDMLLAAINASSGRNTASADKFPRCVLPRTFDFGFRLQLMAKDVSLCLQEAARSRTPMVLAASVDQLWRVADALADEEDDCTRIVLMLEKWAGVVIEGDGSGRG